MKKGFKISFIFVFLIFTTCFIYSIKINAQTSNYSIEEGTYILKNGHLDKYMQIDNNDASNNFNTNQAIMEVWAYEGGDYQKWFFDYLDNGYYKIVSVKSSKVVSVAFGNENSSNDALVQETYTGSLRQQWKITLSSHGLYILKARSSEPYSTNRVMCIGEGIGGNGRNVEQREYSNNTIYKDEWHLIKLMPTSGSERAYDTGLWNYSPVVDSTNCFSYALNNQVKPNTNQLWAMQPTFSDGSVITQSDITVANIESYIANVALAYNFAFERIAKYQACPSGSYKVALVIDPGTDYHWYRQNPDGTWSHKSGLTNVIDTDASGEKIYDPAVADRNYSGMQGCIYIDLNYSEFIGYYKVTPLGKMYINLKSSQNFTINDVIGLATNKTKFPNPLDITTIQKGMTYSNVTKKIGLPQYQLSFGLIILGYELDNGCLLEIEYVNTAEGRLIVENITLRYPLQEVYK